MKVSQLVAYISRMRPHYWKYIFVDRPSPSLHIFWTFPSIPALTPVQTSSKSYTSSSSSSSSTATRHCVVSNAIRILDSTTIQLDFDASSSSFLISRRSLFEIISRVKKGNFILRLVWERIGSIRGTKLFLSIDSVMDELVERWYMDVYRDNTRFVMQPTSFVPPIFFDFQFFLSQTLIKGSFFFEIEGKQIRGTIYFIIIKEFTKRGFSFFFLRIIILVFARLDRTLCQRIDRPEDRARCLPAECSLQFHQILWILLLSLTTKGSPDGKYRPRYSSINFLPFHFPLLCEKYAKSTY